MQNKQILAIIEELPANTLVVLKGYNAQECGGETFTPATILENKIARLIELSQKARAIISFDEFVCLYELIMAQYQNIAVIENSLYKNFYPVDAVIPKEVANSLLCHFDPEADENSKISAIDDYTQVYSNFLANDDNFVCCHNLCENALKHEKIRIIQDQEVHAELEFTENTDESLELLNLCDELDYFNLIQRLYSTSRCFSLCFESFAGGRETMARRLQKTAALFPGRILVKSHAPTPSRKTSYPEVKNLMMKFWGYSDFRDIKVYNMKELERGSKRVVSISQEQIINDIIEQTELCINNNAFKDIFVTAPTGSGKSLMFQLPAMYLAEKYNLVTLVITPLIGLMNDQVQALKRRGYEGACTINSDISPILKQDILNSVIEGKTHILYLSPESLLSKSDIEQLIGNRKIGMLVVDESHIVTTWGKQFRPDYWYLGDHVQKLRQLQASQGTNASGFVIATFTATAIYQGCEDMYHETLNSLHMLDPITYLGYIRRENIEIIIRELKTKKNRTEYEIDKFDALIANIKASLIRNQKNLIYFPTVSLINRFYDYCYSLNLSNYVTRYHGQLDAVMKNDAYRDFCAGDKMVMLATKAFGMGIDISDIAVISHFAPTGNVCDYLQEIGRAARDSAIAGKAIYDHMTNDFKHINRLHGLSAIQPHQLTEVIKKVLDMYLGTRNNATGFSQTRKRNEMLVDTESFAYIFDSPFADENTLINKVKTAMLLVQKDYEIKGFSPFYVRPIPLFAYGYFSLDEDNFKRLTKSYNVLELVCDTRNVYRVNLKKIWEKSYSDQMSFPKFKFLIYSKDKEFEFNKHYKMDSATAIDVFMSEKLQENFYKIITSLKNLIGLSTFRKRFIRRDELVNGIAKEVGISLYQSETIINVVISAMEVYRKELAGKLNINIFRVRTLRDNQVSYKFNAAAGQFFKWLEKEYLWLQNALIKANGDRIFVVNRQKNTRNREVATSLGILEAFGLLRFKTLGGSNSQLYIYVNETKTMRMVNEKPHIYKNKLLERINNRHNESVKMLTQLFQNNLSSDAIWERLENYFLSIKQ